MSWPRSPPFLLISTVGMEVGIQGPRIILPVQQDEGRRHWPRRPPQSEPQSFRDVLHPWEGGACLCQGFRATFVIPPSSVPGLDACPGGSSRPWNAPCWADPPLWVSLGGLPTASVGAGERDASALLECPAWDWRGFRRGRWHPAEGPPPSEAVLVSPALSAFRCGCGGAGSPPLCALSHPTETGKPRGLWHPEWPPVTWEGGACFDGGASHTHPSFLTGQLWERPHDPEHLLWR